MIKLTTDVKAANVITHGGVFHADDVIATVILEKVLSDITVCRVFKVPEEINDDVIIYDIGSGKFDHHQPGGNGTRKNGVPYASAGLIWREFGHEFLSSTCNPDMIWNLVDKNLIQGIDATDNGTMPMADYPVHSLSVSQIISGFNPTWDSSVSADESFLKAVTFAKTIFDNILTTAASTAIAEDIVEKAIECSEGHIMLLDRFVPWQNYVFSSANPKADEIQFVVFPSNRGGFNWQCVPDAPGGFGQRKPVPVEWRGLNGSDLQKVTGISTATFCHPAGFIGSATTVEDAIALAKLAVEA